MSYYLFFEKLFIWKLHIYGYMEDEYELIPLNPIRRLEKRIERLEKGGGGTETVKELTEIVRANQHVIDNVVKLNTDMLTKVSEMVSAVNNMTAGMNDFMSRIEIASAGKEEESPQNDELEKKVDDRLVKLEKRVNAMILSSMKVRR